MLLGLLIVSLGVVGQTYEDDIYSYSPIGKRDPFRSPAYVEDPRPRTALQKMELDELKLIGVMSRGATRYALIEAPNGKGYTLVRGTLIGEHGRISAIEGECVTVHQEYADYIGRRVTSDVKLCLAPTVMNLD